MKWIAIVTDSDKTFQEFVKSLIGEEEYNLAIKSRIQICTLGLTKYVKVFSPDQVGLRDWSNYYVPMFNKTIEKLKQCKNSSTIQ